MALLAQPERLVAGPMLDARVEHALGAVVAWDIGSQVAVDYQAWLSGKTIEVTGGPAIANPAWLAVGNKVRGPQFWTPRPFSTDETLTCWLLNEIRERGWDVALLGNGIWTCEVMGHGGGILSHAEDPSLPYAVSAAFVGVVGLDKA